MLDFDLDDLALDGLDRDELVALVHELADEVQRLQEDLAGEDL